jgi:catechol 2,3-dioxygenase-like lactoylglutathione lyase family enzyme
LEVSNAIALFRPKGEAGAEEIIMISNLQMITIYVSDMTRAVEFYTEKLGFVKLAEYNDGKDNYLTWVIPQPASKDDLATQIALQELADKNDPRIGSISGMVFTTQTAEDIESTYQELKSRGVHFTKELLRHDYGKGLGDQEARFVDPDGNEFLLHT